ncbi:MAG: hypothetical protein AAGG48_32160 [Planctomycetota bacterium]
MPTVLQLIMVESEFFERCKRLIGDNSDRTWCREDLAGFLNDFRSRRSELSSLFADIPHGREVCQRVFNIFDAASSGDTPGRTDLYCVVRRPKPVQATHLKDAATELLKNWCSMAEQQEEQELVDFLTPLPEIQLSYSPAPDIDPNDCNSLDVYIYDTQTDWHCYLKPVSEHSSWMREAFYYLNCDYYLARYATWPWYSDSSQLDDPYLPYFKLWSHGAELRCVSPANVTLYVVQPVGSAEP